MMSTRRSSLHLLDTNFNTIRITSAWLQTLCLSTLLSSPNSTCSSAKRWMSSAEKLRETHWSRWVIILFDCFKTFNQTWGDRGKPRNLEFWLLLWTEDDSGFQGYQVDHSLSQRHLSHFYSLSFLVRGLGQ